MTTPFALEAPDAAGQVTTVYVTPEALLAALVAAPTPRSLWILYQWLMFCLGATAADHAGIAATWTAAERQTVARFLRQEAACLEALL